MRNKRLIPALCVQIKDNVFKPVWELEYVKSEMYGEGFKTKDNLITGAIWNDMIECYWDTKKHMIVFGKVKKVIPTKTEFEKGETVFVEVKHNFYYESVVDDILFEDYETQIVHVKKLSTRDLEHYFPDELVHPDDIYELHQYKPTYVLRDGKKIKWDFMLKHKLTSGDHG